MCQAMTRDTYEVEVSEQLEPSESGGWRVTSRRRVLVVQVEPAAPWKAVYDACTQVSGVELSLMANPLKSCLRSKAGRTTRTKPMAFRELLDYDSDPLDVISSNESRSSSEHPQDVSGRDQPGENPSSRQEDAHIKRCRRIGCWADRRIFRSCRDVRRSQETITPARMCNSSSKLRHGVGAAQCLNVYQPAALMFQTQTAVHTSSNMCYGESRNMK